MKQLLAITSLLLSTALLLVGHGMQLTLLPLRAAADALPEYLIGETTLSTIFWDFSPSPSPQNDSIVSFCAMEG